MMKIAFVISMVSTMLLVTFKIMHIKFVDVFFYTYLITTAVWVIMAIMEIWSSTRLPLTEKMMWTVSLIVFGCFAGMLYFLNGRHRVIARSNHFDRKSLV